MPGRCRQPAGELTAVVPLTRPFLPKLGAAIEFVFFVGRSHVVG